MNSVYKIFINKIAYFVKFGCVTGVEIRVMGSIPINEPIRFQIPGHPYLIELNDHDFVDLTGRPSIENFITEFNGKVEAE